MSYEKFKKIMTKEEFYSYWEKDKYNSLSEDNKDYIYNDYIVDCKVLQRDNFMCQHREGENNECPICHNIQYYHNLQKHHIKAKRNGGKDTVRNQVTICGGIHKRYERKLGMLKFLKTAVHLPPKLRGKIFKQDLEKKEFKKLKIKGNIIRKKIKLEIMNKIEEFRKKEIPIEHRRWFTYNIDKLIEIMKCLEKPYWEWKEYKD